MEKIHDKELDQVSGGKSILNHMVTSNSSTYSSGSTPKYRVGQALKIKYIDDCANKHTCGCIVESVSDSANCGSWCPEFGYTVRITSIPYEMHNCGVTIGEVYTNVYESCLYEK